MVELHQPNRLGPLELEMQAYARALSDWALDAGQGGDIPEATALMREANLIRGAVLEAKWSEHG